MTTHRKTQIYILINKCQAAIFVLHFYVLASFYTVFSFLCALQIFLSPSNVKTEQIKCNYAVDIPKRLKFKATESSYGWWDIFPEMSNVVGLILMIDIF